tara:strand:+ start:797 stop:2131 length:1335 start_codon:yes stop_codon:yes gene_type:complete
MADPFQTQMNQGFQSYLDALKRIQTESQKNILNQQAAIDNLSTASTTPTSSRFMEGDQGFLDALKNPSESQRNLMIQFGLGLAGSDSTKDLSQRLALALGPGIQSMQATREKEKQRNILTQQMNLKKLGLEQQGLSLEQSIQGNIYQATKANQDYKLQLKKYNLELAGLKGTNQYVNGREIFVDGSNNYQFIDGSAVSQEQLTNASPNKPNIPTIVNLINARNQALSDPNANPEDIAILNDTIIKHSSHPPQADPFLNQLGKKQAEFLIENYQKTNEALANLPVVDNLIKSVDTDGIITGKAAYLEETLVGYLDELNLLSADKSAQLAETQAFMATQARRVAQIIKDFGAGTGLSDADREYALKAAGDINMTKEAILKILKMSKITTEFMRKNHNTSVNRIMKKYNQAERDTMLFPDSGYVLDLKDMTRDELRNNLEQDFGTGG